MTFPGVPPGSTVGAVFLDKDGTLIEDLPWNVDPQRIRLAPRGAAALGVLARLAMPIVVISNQPGVALGRFAAAALAPVRARLAALCGQHGARLHDVLFCPHAPGAGCACRKPAPGLLLAAAGRHGLCLPRSWMVGDILDDIEAGRRAGCRTILLDNGHETEWRCGPRRRPDLVVPDLLAAALAIATLRAGSGRTWRGCP